MLSEQDMSYIRHAYLAGVERGKRFGPAAGAELLEDRLQGAIGFSVAHVERYSPDQQRWAMARAVEEAARGRRPASAAELAARRVRLTGADFARYFPRGAEDGTATAAGNIFVHAGLTNLISLWMGLTGTAVNALSGTGSVCGVGTGTAYANAGGTTDVKLTGDGLATGAFYDTFDNAASLATTSTPGAIAGTMTVGSGDANFAWAEWCWATGAGAVTKGPSLGTAAATPFATPNSAAMINHKVNVALGTKASGSSWVFSTTFQISL